jgi:hypothetical protein
MDAFDSIIAARMLFEMWAKWNHTVWLAREKDIWDQLQRLGKECISRQVMFPNSDKSHVRDDSDQWEEDIRSDITASSNTSSVGGLDASAEFELSSLDLVSVRDFAM